MPHSTLPSAGTSVSFTSDDSDFSSSSSRVAVAQPINKHHHSTVFTIPSRRESMATTANATATATATATSTSTPTIPADFSFLKNPLPSLSTSTLASTPDTTKDRSDSLSSVTTAIPYQPLQPPNVSGPSLDSRERTRYFEQQLAFKDQALTSRDRVTRDAPVICELRTNVIRPETSIAVTIQHSACLCLGGSFQPAYILTMTTLPSLMQPATNKRNTALIQSFMSDELSVPADRGILRFMPLAEENFATNGRTMLSEIERLEKQAADESALAKRGVAKAGRRSMVLRRAKSQELNRKGSAHTLATSTPSREGHKSPTPPKPPRPSQGLGGLGLPSPQAGYEPEPFDTSSTGLLINGRGNVVNAVTRISPPALSRSPVDSKMGSPQHNPTHQVHVDVGRWPTTAKQKQKPPLMTAAELAKVPAPPPIPVLDERTEKAKKLTKRRSIISIFSRKSSAS